MIRSFLLAILSAVGVVLAGSSPLQATPHIGAAPIFPPTIGLPEGQITVTPTCDSLVLNICVHAGLGPYFPMTLSVNVRNAAGVYVNQVASRTFNLTSVGSCQHYYPNNGYYPGTLYQAVVPINPLEASTFDAMRGVMLTFHSIPGYLYRVIIGGSTWIINRSGSAVFTLPACPNNTTMKGAGSCTGVNGSVCVLNAYSATRLITAYRVNPANGAILGTIGSVIPIKAAVNTCIAGQTLLQFAFPINGINNLVPGDYVRFVMSHQGGVYGYTRLKQGTTGSAITIVRAMDPGMNSCLNVPPPPF